MTATTGRYEALIRDWCQRTGRTHMSTTEAGELIGVPRRTVSRWVRNYSIPYQKKPVKKKGGFRIAYQIEAKPFGDWLDKFHLTPVGEPKSNDVPPAEWGWQQDQKINCVTDKQ
jgi:hypothetical protein